MTPRRGLMLPWVWELWILGFWWSTWTLADTYLIRFTPWSELLVLGVCGSTLLLAAARAERTFDKMLDGVTQTNTVGVQQKAGP